MIKIRGRKTVDHRWRPGLLTGFLLSVCLLIVNTGWSMELDGMELSVRSTTSYRLQWADTADSTAIADDDRDEDFSQILAADIKWAEQGFRIAAMGRYIKDTDGTPSGSIFQDYTDSRNDHRQDFDAYYAYLEKDDFLSEGMRVRLGRQYAYGAETVHFDGLHLRYERPDWQSFEIEVFGGRLVQHYVDLAEEGVGGYHLSIRPLTHLVLSLDGVFSDQVSTEASIYWQPLENVQGLVRVAFIDDEIRFADFSTQVLIPSSGTVINVDIYRRFEVDSESALLFDYTYTQDTALSDKITSLYLLQELDYMQYDLKISQPIPSAEGLTIYGRYTKRILMDDKDEDLYNTDFDRYTIGFNIDEWLDLEGFHLSAGYSFWQEQRDLFYEGESSSYFADVRQELLDGLEIGAGFYHKSEDVNSLIENETSTRYQASVKYRFMESAWVKLLYQYDEDDYFEDELGVDSINALTMTLHVEY